MSGDKPDSPEPNRKPRLAPILAAAWVGLPLFFLVTGGSLDWWQAWAYCVVILPSMTGFVLYLGARDPEFLSRRLKVREKEKTQRLIQSGGAIAFLASAVLPGLDHRLGWSRVPFAAAIVALILVEATYLAIARVFLVNRWASRTVETYIGQQIVSTGPYAIVRHPMYAATILMYLATPVALGSWWGVLPALTLIPIMVLRIRNEEEVLLRELAGYEEYRRKVRYRLLPCVW